ncbi:superoxide dismutase [Neorickettsia helminthoeca]|uniref:superoxide dismutase n=1 Tax=Neorickettsia helminthoeca TaxID=33994 RepID=UPI000A01FE2D|nr:superoxide dismutase [Neorickettsia helminthoeca]
MKIILPELPYHKDALEPLISEKTLGFHYDKHHAGYVNKVNELLVESDDVGDTLLCVIRNTWNKQGKEAIFNNAAQVWNHTFYWNSMRPPASACSPDDRLMLQIVKDFGGMEELKQQLSLAAVTQFGSGWAWLIFDKASQRLSVVKTSNAETPLTNQNFVPLLAIDVWEHAYYLDYQNRRPDYVATFLAQLINWDFASANYSAVG